MTQLGWRVFSPIPGEGGNWPIGGRNRSALLSLEVIFRLLGQPSMSNAIQSGPAVSGSVQCTEFKEEPEDEEVS